MFRKILFITGLLGNTYSPPKPQPAGVPDIQFLTRAEAERHEQLMGFRPNTPMPSTTHTNSPDGIHTPIRIGSPTDPPTPRSSTPMGTGTPPRRQFDVTFARSANPTDDRHPPVRRSHYKKRLFPWSKKSATDPETFGPGRPLDDTTPEWPVPDSTAGYRASGDSTATAGTPTVEQLPGLHPYRYTFGNGAPVRMPPPLSTRPAREETLPLFAPRTHSATSDYAVSYQDSSPSYTSSLQSPFYYNPFFSGSHSASHPVSMRTTPYSSYQSSQESSQQTREREHRILQLEAENKKLKDLLESKDPELSEIVFKDLEHYKKLLEEKKLIIRFLEEELSKMHSIDKQRAEMADLQKIVQSLKTELDMYKTMTVKLQGEFDTYRAKQSGTTLPSDKPTFTLPGLLSDDFEDISETDQALTPFEPPSVYQTKEESKTKSESQTKEESKTKSERLNQSDYQSPVTPGQRTAAPTSETSTPAFTNEPDESAVRRHDAPARETIGSTSDTSPTLSDATELSPSDETEKILDQKTPLPKPDTPVPNEKDTDVDLFDDNAHTKLASIEALESEEEDARYDISKAAFDFISEQEDVFLDEIDEILARRRAYYAQREKELEGSEDEL